MKLNFFLTTVYVFLFASFSMAQVNTCGTDYMNQKYAQAHPDRVAYQEQMREAIRSSAYVETTGERATVVIPTVVHVMHMGGAENISNAQVEDGIRVLNEDMRRMNSDTGNTRAIFKQYGANFNIEFRLAKLDPNGNCTNGITNTFSSITNSADDAIKNTSQGGKNAWPVNKYFNIWVVGRIQIDQDNVIGYAYFPSWGMSSEYGVVINNRYFGTIGSAQGHDGRTLTHEVGHCLELYHTFQSGCGGNCSTTGDDVCDTPPVITASYSCNFNLNTCSNDQSGPSPYTSDMPDMIENYMSYNQDGCQNIFTKGQKLRSDGVLQNTFLAQLVTSQNLTATGTSDGFTNACALQPDFIWNKPNICIGDSVKFTDLTHNGDPTSYQWNISGGGTYTASVANPTVVFTQAGLYTVSLNVTNAAGTQNVVKNAIIRVADTAASVMNFVDGFDNQPLLSGRWHKRNAIVGNGWEEKITTNGNATVYVNNYSNDTETMLSELYSPMYNLSLMTDPKFTFKTAYALKSGNTSDRLKMYISDDCGETWILRFSKTGEMLASMDASTLPVEPSNPGDWMLWESAVPSIMLGATHFSVKFTFETGGGNNIYLDDINITGVMDINESTTQSTLGIYPNPTHDLFTLDLLSMAGDIEISIYDMSGRLVRNKQTTGGNTVSISAREMDLGAGMYRISAKGKTGILSSKIIVTQ